MGEYFTEVVKIGAVVKHGNADTLDIVSIFDDPEAEPGTTGFQCISKSGLWKTGQLACYFSVDTMLPLDNPLFTWLAGKNEKMVDGKSYARIRGQRLRGVFSLGVLIEAPEGAKEGDNVAALMSVIKYEPPQSFHSKGGSNQDINMAGGRINDPCTVPVYDVEGVRKFSRLFTPGEEVVVQEKLNGMNCRTLFYNGELFVGSRTRFKKRNEEDDFWRVAIRYDLENKLKQYPNIMMVSELIGGVSDMRYGLQKGNAELAFFDAFDVTTQEYLDFDVMKSMVEGMGLQIAPIVYRGPYDRAVIDPLAEQDSIYPGTQHLSEGVVIRSITERLYLGHQRAILKYVGQRYHLRK